MERYANRGGDSSVEGYEIEHDSITVQFRDGWKYLYTYQSTGAEDIERMKLLAISGHGLNSFITRVIRKRFASKFR
ncbi:MAG: hypothetical protein HQL10_12380 [Nitrospirae bacterium]|nr:hypothetical protein [Nitrospirota bacterium]